MIQGFSVSLGVFIRRLLITIFISNNSFSQVLPFTFSAHHKKNETQTNYALSFDGANDYINTGVTTISSNWSAEVWFKEAAQNISNDDWIKFEDVSLKDGYYAIASTDNNL